MAPPRRRTRPTGMSPGAMGGRIGSPVTSKPKPSTMSPGERRARTGFAVPKQDLAKQFFKGPVSDDRLRRRLQQDREERDFISTLKPAGGSPTNLLQEQAPTFNPMTGQYERTTLAQKRQQLANLYGPTLSEIGSDIGFGIRSVGGQLVDRFSRGELGIVGIAKNLYDKFSSNAAKAKDALVEGVNKLSDIDLEFLKNEEKYPQMSSHPRLQGIKDIQEIGRTETEKADIIKQNMETLTTPVTEVSSPTVATDSFRRLPATGMTQTSPTIDPFRRMPGTGYQAGAGMGIAAIPAGFEIVSDYKSPEAKMQELIEQNTVNNTNMFDLGINKAKNQISELERVFGVDMQ